MSRLLFAMTVLMVPVAALAVVPVNGTTPTLVPVTINDGLGDQNDPHVSGDWAAYASDFAIRYYHFETATSVAADAQIPMGGPLTRDLLSDISGTKIVFSRIIPSSGTSVMVFDAATPAALPITIDPAAGTTRLGSAIGGSTVAYVDSGLLPISGNGEIIIHDLATSMSVRVTNDDIMDQNPSVSPDGRVVTWEHCQSSLANCDIWQAVKTGTGWAIGVTSDNVSPEGNPDTNGTLAVYDSSRGGNSDIFWRPVSGGAEVQLQLTGSERNPSIAANFIAFESRASLLVKADLYVYDITANRLYQITSTPTVTEQLNDITVLPSGALRVVWASDEDGLGSRNVHGATFSFGPPVPVDSNKVLVCHIPPGNPGNAHTISVGKAAVKAHLGHGDTLGDCAPAANDGERGVSHIREHLSGAPDAKSEPMGCSSAGGAPTVLMLLAVAAWMLIGRSRKVVPARARRS